MQFYTRDAIQAFDSVRFMYIKTTLAGHIFTLTLSRPEKRNAFTPTMAAEIAFALAYAHYNDDVRCVIVNAEGPVFCAGADLNAFHDPTMDQVNTSLPAPWEEIRLGDAFAALSKPCISQVEGPVLAGGFLIICGCTLVISVPEAVFGLPEVKRGIWPMQVMASLLPVIPQRKILEMAITGRNYSSAEALQMGLLTEVVEREEIASKVGALADQICENAPLAIQKGVQAMRHIQAIPDSEKHSYLKTELDYLLQSEDAREGAKAFAEKRKPVWKNR
nr:enoyl-CoA hydratase-related protein [uncultured Dyadobacter sp.]